MIADLKPYAEYKDSGLPWLGQVPAHWETRRLRASIVDCVNGIWGSDPNGKDDLVCVRVADFDRVNLRVSLRKKTVRAIPTSVRSRRVLRRGDLLLEKSGGGDLQPVGAVVAFDHDVPAVCSNFVARMPLAAGYNNFYVNYLHATLYAYRINVRSIKQTTGIQNLDGKAYLAELVAFPPPAEQAAIVRFLDWANGRLERAIRAKRKVIALLNEQKQAIIHRAVTRGLDPSVPLKPSGIPWLGEIPAHWEMVRSRRLFVARKELARPDDVQLSATQLYGVIPQDEFERRVGRRVVKIFMHLEKRKHVEKDDFVISMRSFQGGIERAWAVGAIRSSYVVLKPNKSVDVGFFAYLLKSRGYIGALQATADFIRDGQDLTEVNFRRVDLPLPPISEQARIASGISDLITGVVAEASRLEREIDLLREYRTRLVADVVTGKLDVREAAARLPDEEPLDLVEDDAEMIEDPESLDEEVGIV